MANSRKLLRTLKPISDGRQ